MNHSITPVVLLPLNPPPLPHPVLSCRELCFDGVPGRSTVTMMPTVNCLVELTEWPAVVITLNDIEIVNLERVGYNLKNFDMAIVFKVGVYYFRGNPGGWRGMVVPVTHAGVTRLGDPALNTIQEARKPVVAVSHAGVPA